MDNRTKNGWLKTDEIKTNFAEQLKTGKIVVVGMKPAKEGMQVHLVQNFEGSMDSLGKIIDLAGYTAVGGDTIRHAWQAFDEKSAMYTLLDKAEAGVLFDDLVEEALGEEHAFTSSIFFQETTDPTTAKYKRDGEVLMSDPVFRPAREKYGETEPSVAFNEGGSPVWRRSSVRADGETNANDIILNKTYSPLEQWESWKKEHLGIKSAKEAINLEE